MVLVPALSVVQVEIGVGLGGRVETVAGAVRWNKGMGMWVILKVGTKVIGKQA